MLSPIEGFEAAVGADRRFDLVHSSHALEFVEDPEFRIAVSVDMLDTGAFNRTVYEDGRFKEANDDLTGMVLHVERIFASLIPIATLLAFLLIIILLAVGYIQINRLTDPTEIADTIGDLQAFIIYLVFVVIAVGTAAAMFIMIPRANISAKRINAVLEMDPEMTVTPTEAEDAEA